MELNVPNFDSTAIKSRFRRADLPAIDDIQAPSVSLPSIEATRSTLDDAGKAAVELASEAGSQVAELAADASRVIGSAIEVASERLHDLRATVMSQPARPSMFKRGALAVGLAAIVGSLAAGAAFLFHPSQGPRRRAAIRRRLGAGAAMTRSSVDSAVVAARKASDRTAELVKIPIESAKDMVGSRNGHVDGNGASPADESVLATAGESVLTTAGEAIDATAGTDLQPENLGEPQHEGEPEKAAVAEAVGE